MMAFNKQKLAYAYVVLAAVIFSTMEIATKMVVTEINPFQLAFIRFLIGGVVLLPWAVRALKERGLKLNKDDAVFFFKAGLLGIVITMSLFQLSLVFAKASTVAIIVCANPLFIIPFAWIMLKEKLTKRTILSLAISMLGILCILNPFQLNPDITGIVLAILSTVTFALYTVMGKKRSARYGSIILTCFSFFSGSLLLFAGILFSHIPWLPAAGDNEILRQFLVIPLTGGISWSNIAQLLYIGVVVSGLGFLLYFQAMEMTSAAIGSVVFFIKPALAPVLAFLVLAEAIPVATVAGIVLITLSTYIAFTGTSGPED